MAKKLSKRIAKKKAKQAQQAKKQSKIISQIKIPGTNKVITVKQDEKLDKDLLKYAVEWASKGKQTTTPVNIKNIILNNASETIQSVTPDEMNGVYTLLDLLSSDFDPTKTTTTKNKFVKTTQDYKDYSWQWNDFWRNKKQTDVNIALNILYGAIESSQTTEEEVAKRIEQNAGRITELVDRIKYDSKGEAIQHDIEEFTEILLGRKLNTIESRRVSANLDKIRKQSIDNYLRNKTNYNTDIINEEIPYEQPIFPFDK